jgi:thiol reductant ABC exporter CydD subunit
VESVDRRLLRRAAAARAALAFDAGLGVAGAFLILAQATLIGTIIASAFAGADIRFLLLPFALLVGVVAGRALAASGFEIVGRWATARVIATLRSNIVRSLLARAGEIDERTADLATATVEGADALEAYFSEYLPQVVLAALVPVAVLIVVAHFDLISAGLMLVTLPVAFVFMWLMGHTAAERNRERWQNLSMLAAHFSDVVKGLATLRAFNRGSIQTERIAEVSDAYRRATMETLRLSFLSGAVLDLAGTLGVALVAVTVGVRLVDGTISFGPGLIVLLLVPELFLPVRNLGARYHASAEGRAVAGRLLDLAQHQPDPDRKRQLPQPSGLVRVEDVWVSYPGGRSPALAGVDLQLNPGELVALVGASGAGKSTLAALLVLLIRPARGRVLADGADLALCDPDSWRANVAWMPQRPTLLRASVAANVRFGDPDADAGRVRAACRAAGADRFIKGLPDRYETVIGDGGRPLSSGERRRIALARAFLRRASLLVLDEPTAHLDVDAADIVSGTIRARRGRQTILVITHREELISAADRVVRLDAGRIVDLASQPIARSA